VKQHWLNYGPLAPHTYTVSQSSCRLKSVTGHACWVLGVGTEIPKLLEVSSRPVIIKRLISFLYIMGMFPRHFPLLSVDFCSSASVHNWWVSVSFTVGRSRISPVSPSQSWCELGLLTHQLIYIFLRDTFDADRALNLFISEHYKHLTLLAFHNYV